jgi:hypothetical protein
MDTHDPASVVFTLGGNLITGFMPGTYLTVERDEDTWTLNVGADGEVARVRNRNKAGRITLTLMQTSQSNAILSALAAQDEAAPGGAPAGAAVVKDLLGTTLLGGDQAYVLKPAASSFGKELEGREWIVVVPKLEGVVGGSL